MRFAIFAAVLALAALAGATSDAVVASWRLVSPDPIELRGTLEVAVEGGVFVTDAKEADGAAEFSGATGRLTVWSWNASRADVLYPSGRLSATNRVEDARPRSFLLDDARIRVELQGEPFGLRAVAVDGEMRIAGDTASSGVPVFVGHRVTSGLGADVSLYQAPEEVPWAWEPGWAFQGVGADIGWPTGWPAWAHPAVELQGAVRLQVFGGTLSFVDGNGTARVERLGATTLASQGVDFADARLENIRWAVFEGTVGPSSVPAGDLWGLAAPVASWSLTGDVRWRNATGSVTVDGKHHALQGVDVWMSGAMRFVPGQGAAFLDAPAAYTGRGSMDGLTIGGRPAVQGYPEGPVEEVSWIAAALGALGLAWWALLSRLARKGPDDHPTRQAILGLVAREPGIHKRELARRVGRAWGVFQFHLHILERADRVRIRRDGHYRRVYPADEPPRDTLPRIPSPRARLVYDAIPADRPKRLSDIRDELGISYQLVRYHVRQLAERGLVREIATPGRPEAVRVAGEETSSGAP